MALTAWTNIGPYEILAPLGAGGMGEVYRARDPRLTPTGMLMAVSMKPGLRLEAGVPQPLFQTPITSVILNLDQYDATRATGSDSSYSPRPATRARHQAQADLKVRLYEGRRS